MITHVAIQHTDGRVFSLPKPFRHNHVIKMMVEICELPKPISGEQGFLNHKGRFLNRKDAAINARLSGQLHDTLYDPERLFSEDLW